MKALKYIVDEITKEGGVDAVILFGSRARGNAKPLSDIDLCVVTGKDAKKERILRNSSERIDTSIFWDLPLNIRYRVVKEGKPLYVRDELLMHRIKVRTVLSYLDFKPVLDRHFSRFLS